MGHLTTWFPAFLAAGGVAIPSGAPGDPAATCAGLLAGMEAMGPMLRESGQFGVQRPVAADALAQDRLVAFIGRDPHWRP